MTPLETAVSAAAQHGGAPKKSGSGYKIKCPCHDDQQHSLQLARGDKGVVLHCHAGCETRDIVHAWGLEWGDLFDGEPTPKNEPPVFYDYTDAKGKLVFQVERKAGKKFMQRRPGTKKGEWVYNLTGVKRPLYRLPAVIEAIERRQPVFVPEGEKDVASLEKIGLVGTCNAGGAQKWRPEYGVALRGAHVVVLPDNDEPGMLHAQAIAQSCKEHARSVRIVKLPNLPTKGDVTDWIARGGDRKQLLALADDTTPVSGNHRIFTAPELMDEEFKDIQMAVPGIVAEGCTFLVGAPKIGKSWMALGLGLAVAAGDPALGVIECPEGEVLYMALEDTPRRLQRRITQMRGSTKTPDNLFFACVWPTFSKGGLEQLENWLQDHPKASMVIIDTFQKIKAQAGEESMYAADYSAVSAIKGLADTYNAAIVLVHHQRKATDNDPLNTVAGSTGLTGAADATAILTRSRNSQDGYLYITGRDVEESKSVVSFDGDTGNWLYLGEAEAVEEQRTEDAVVQLLALSTEPMGPKEVAEALEMKEGTAKWILPKLLQEGKISKKGRGKYYVDDPKAIAQSLVGGPPKAANQPTNAETGEQQDIEDVIAAHEAEFSADDGEDDDEGEGE